MAEAAHTHEHTEEKKLSPKFEMQEVGPCKHKLKIEVAAPTVKEMIDDKYHELSESVALPGFRKGHAPRTILERKFGKAMLDDLKFELLSRSFEEVKEEKKLEPVGEPDVAEVEKLAVQEGKPFVYEVTIEVRPVFEIKNYEGIAVQKPALKVDEKEIEVVIKNFLDSKAELAPVEDQTAREHDQIVADFVLMVDGQPKDQSENNALFLDSEIQFYGLELKDFHTALEGKKVGDTVDYSVDLPADFAVKADAGKRAVIRTTIKAVKRKVLPELTVDFVKKHFDMDTLDEFRQDIVKRITREKEAQARAQMGEKIVEELIKTNDFAMPEGLIASGTEEALRRVHLDLAMKGAPDEEIQKTLEKERGASRENMAKALKGHFILEHLAQKVKIFVTEDQVEERIGMLATRYGKWPHEMKAYLEERGLITQLRRQMREELVREYLLSKAVIQEEAK
jgi:trigger factor